MKNNKLNTSNSALRRFSSTDLVITQQAFPTSIKNRYISQNPLVFSLESKIPNKFNSFDTKNTTYNGVFSF